MWIDTYCIDKMSSAELSESINSMFAWYAGAVECCVLLDDVPMVEAAYAEESIYRSGTPVHDLPDLARSRWFSRGWTLQELLAPSSMLFYNRIGEFIRTRSDLATTISRASGTQTQYLEQKLSFRRASIAQRMSWAAQRRTTRPEDVAYSLLGLFNVNMPLLYGEGDKAFLRLQLAIIEQSNDDSIFAWGLHHSDLAPRGLLAKRPRDFAGSERVVSFPISGNNNGSAFHGSLKEITYRYTVAYGELVYNLIGWPELKERKVRLVCGTTEVDESIQNITLRITSYGRLSHRVDLRKEKCNTFDDFIRGAVAIEQTVQIAAVWDDSMSNEPRIKHAKFLIQLRSSLGRICNARWILRFVLSLALSLIAVIAAGMEWQLSTILVCVSIVMFKDLWPSGFLFFLSGTLFLAIFILYQVLIKHYAQGNDATSTMSANCTCLVTSSSPAQNVVGNVSTLYCTLSATPA